MKHSLLFLSYVTAVTASFGGNLNYRSPSHNHPALGVSIHKVAKRNIDARAFPANKLNFTHGVASGDPLPSSVILWTRAAPMMASDNSNVTVEGFVPLYNHETKEYVQASKNPVCVQYKVGTDRKFQRIVSRGKAYTTSDIDWTIKVSFFSLSPEDALLSAECVEGAAD